MTRDALGLLPIDLPDDPHLRRALALPELPDRAYTVPTFAEATAEADEWEARIGVMAVAVLDDLFRQVDDRMAPLSTLFRGQQNTNADAARKQHRAWIGSCLIAEGKAEPTVAENKIERLANADPRHIRYFAALRLLNDRYNELWRDRKALERMNAERDHRINTYRTELANTR